LLPDTSLLDVAFGRSFQREEPLDDLKPDCEPPTDTTGWL
jgi:hypothetical protein